MDEENCIYCGEEATTSYVTIGSVVYCGPYCDKCSQTILDYIGLGTVGTQVKRKVYWQDNLDGYTDEPKRQRLVYDIKDANLISSDVGNGMHSPVLDIDFPCRLVPSSTPGHYHLYLDGLVMPWHKYVRFLNMLAKYGVIERGFAGVSIKRRRSCVRLPHIKKPEAEVTSDKWENLMDYFFDNPVPDWDDEPEYLTINPWEGSRDDFWPDEEPGFFSRFFNIFSSNGRAGSHYD
jgi:hypothetical protein